MRRQEKSTGKEYRKKIRVRSSEWIGLLGQVAETITRKAEGKRPIIIFEDLDKLNPEDAWEVFYHYVAILSGMKFPVIYTFPIGLSYDTRFSAIESYFITKTLPMIKIETIDNQPFQDGIDIIRHIVEKRAVNKERIENKEMLLKMLQVSVVLEYNGKRWHNVHPLVIKFFREQGMINDVRE